VVIGAASAAMAIKVIKAVMVPAVAIATAAQEEIVALFQAQSATK
jgi:hypothetical protein